MRCVTLAFLAAIVSGPALAQVGDSREVIVRDRSGRVVERLEPGRFDTLTRRDAHGNYLGTVETDRTGRMILKSPGGRHEGTADPLPSIPRRKE